MFFNLAFMIRELVELKAGMWEAVFLLVFGQDFFCLRVESETRQAFEQQSRVSISICHVVILGVKDWTALQVLLYRIPKFITSQGVPQLES